MVGLTTNLLRFNALENPAEVSGRMLIWPVVPILALPRFHSVVVSVTLPAVLKVGPCPSNNEVALTLMLVLLLVTTLPASWPTVAVIQILDRGELSEMLPAPARIWPLARMPCVLPLPVMVMSPTSATTLMLLYRYTPCVLPVPVSVTLPPVERMVPPWVVLS